MDENEHVKFLNQKVVGNRGTKYLITKYISGGGNGFVFECKDNLENIYILKILHTLTTTKVSNFEKEVELQRSLNSEYIVKCLDFGSLVFGKMKKPRPFYIMQKYDTNLEELLNDNRITPLNAYRYIIQLCRGLKVLHKRLEPIIHRDLKPENILYDARDDRVLIGDFGLAHIGNNNNTINDGFAGNIDYHAPEQKLRGKHKVGTYTDIYSLGLIINVLFTKEIAQGEGYKKIWQFAPYFSFLDNWVERMIRHDIETREHDINALLIELEEHELDYEFEESFVENLLKEKGGPTDKAAELMDLFSLLEFTIYNKMKWPSINLNYLCDYHFGCDEILQNSILLNRLYKVVKDKFEYEGSAYTANKTPYLPMDLKERYCKKLYDSFAKYVDNLEVFDEFDYKKSIVKKYYVSLCDYHASEIINEIKTIKKEIDYYCSDAPALFIAYYVSTKLPLLDKKENSIIRHIIFIKYELSDVTNKNEFYHNTDNTIIQLKDSIKQLLPGATFLHDEEGVTVCFDTIKEEAQFEDKLKEISEKIDVLDVNKQDILDILRGVVVQPGLRKTYRIGKHEASIILNLQNS